MRVIPIDSVDDPRLADYRHVSDADLLRRRNLFVAEGRLVVGRIIEGGHRIVSALMNEPSFKALEPVLTPLGSETPVFVCASSDFTALTGFNLHRGCLALAERPADRGFEPIALDAELVLVLEAVTDADNVGSAFRNAWAFGAGGVLLSPTCCDPLYRKSVRTSVGSVLHVPFTRLADWPADLQRVKEKGFTLAALTPASDAIDLSSYLDERVRAKTAILVGTEGAGLSREAEAMADVRVRIPIRPGVDSLNLATATGIALYGFRGRWTVNHR